MSLEEEGAYIRLLCYCWKHGSIPAEPEQIARLIGKGASTTLATTLATIFEPDLQNGSRLIHQRLEEERQKQDEWRAKSAAGGRKSAELRQKHGSRVVEPPYQPKSNSSSSSSSSKREKKTSKNAQPGPDDRFDRFWKAYPQKKSKGYAQKAFLKLNPSEQLMDIMLDAIERAKTSRDWKKESGQFIPYPASWLNAKGWEDEITPGDSVWDIKNGTPINLDDY